MIRIQIEFRRLLSFCKFKIGLLKMSLYYKGILLIIVKFETKIETKIETN